MDPIVQPNRLLLWQGIEPSTDVSTDPSLLQLTEERLRERALFIVQTEGTQQFLRREAISVAEALLESKSKMDFSLPELVNLPGDGAKDCRPEEVPTIFRMQTIGGLLGRFPLKDIRSAFRQRLSHLEDSAYPAVAAGARLLRYAVAWNIVHDRIPAEIETFGGKADPSPESLERKVGEYRRVIETLHHALSLAPYIYTDEDYQAKRSMVVGRLIPLGRRLAFMQVHEMIETIDRRARAGELNLGLRLSVPYFDDRGLALKLYNFDVIPGRTMFVRTFVALAAAREEEKIGCDDSLSPSTRMHLLEEIKTLRLAFEPAGSR